MNLTYQSLEKVPVSCRGVKDFVSQWTFQGIPGIEFSAGGRLFVTWYGGGTTECRENCVALAFSDDGGISWSEPVAAVCPPHLAVRAFDPALWRAPDGRLYWFWAQGCGCASGICGIIDEVFDGLEGVWCSVLENPDAEPAQFRFSTSRRISNGIMLNKPIVLSDGTWALPCSLWSVESSWRHAHESLSPCYGAMMVVSSDQGKSFSMRSVIHTEAIVGGVSFDEHEFVEWENGRVDAYIRTLDRVARSTSCDGGRSWSTPVETAWPGKDCRFAVRRLLSGRLLLIANDSQEKREKLTAFLSEDEGKSWCGRLLLDARQDVTYPDVTLDADGNIYIVYDYKRFDGGYIYLARVTETDILSGRISGDSWLEREIFHSRPVPKKDEQTKERKS